MYALSCGADKTVRLWRLGLQIRAFREKRFSPACVALSPDRQLALVGGSTGLLPGSAVTYLFESKTWKRLAEFPSTIGRATTLAFSADGLRAISAGTRGVEAWQFDLPGTEPVVRIKKFGRTVLSPDGSYALLYNHRPSVWDLRRSGERICSRRLWTWPGVVRFLDPHCVALHPNGSHVFIGGELKDPMRKAVFPSLPGSVTVGRGVTRLLQLKNDRRGLFSLRDPQISFAEQETPVEAIAVMANGKRILLGDYKGEVRLASGRSCSHGASLGAHNRPVTTVAISLDCRRGISGDAGGVLRVWELGDVHNGLRT